MPDLPNGQNQETLTQALADVKNAFEELRNHQNLANHILRCNQIAYYLAFEHLKAIGVPKESLLAAVKVSDKRIDSVLEQYKILTDGKRLRVTVGEFEEHLVLARSHLLDSVLVFYISGFERFLKEWSKAALVFADGPKAKDLADIVKKDYKNVRLKNIIDAYNDAVVLALKEKAPLVGKRESARAESFYMQPGASCDRITDMWRQIRNVIVHHGGQLSKMERADIADLWMKYSRESTDAKQKPSRDDPPVDAERVQLKPKHIVYCFGNIFKTAQVLQISIEKLIARKQSEIRRRVWN